MESSGEEEVKVTDKPKKKIRKTKEWKRNRAKERRYSGIDKISRVTCNHPNHSYCQARKLTIADLAEIKEQFYRDNSKIRQDQYIAMHVKLTPKKRQRNGQQNFKTREFTASYMVSKLNPNLPGPF